MAWICRTEFALGRGTCKLVWARTSCLRHLCDADDSLGLSRPRLPRKNGLGVSPALLVTFLSSLAFSRSPAWPQAGFSVGGRRQPVLLSPICTRHSPFSAGSSRQLYQGFQSRGGSSVAQRAGGRRVPAPASSVPCALGSPGACLSQHPVEPHPQAQTRMSSPEQLSEGRTLGPRLLCKSSARPNESSLSSLPDSDLPKAPILQPVTTVHTVVQIGGLRATSWTPLRISSPVSNSSVSFVGFSS